MKAQLICNGKTIEVEVTDEQIKEFFKEDTKATGYERVETGNIYWYVNSLSEVDGDLEVKSESDQINYDAANYFSDEEVANNIARAQQLWRQINRRAIEICEPCYSRTSSIYYTIYFSIYSDSICPSISGREFGIIYFDTKEHCQQIIDEFYNELLWYFTDFRNRVREVDSNEKY